MVKVNLNLDEIKDKFLEKIYNLLPKAKIRIRKNNILAITVSTSEKKIEELRNDFLELKNAGVEIGIKFAITKVEMKNLDGVYESFDLENEFLVDTLINRDMFQVNERIEWMESNSDYKVAVINGFQITISLAEKNIEKQKIIRIKLS